VRREDTEQAMMDEYEAQRIASLTANLQSIAVAHKVDQFQAEPSMIEDNAQNFVAFCNDLGIVSQDD
jgi:hypothetical protein